MTTSFRNRAWSRPAFDQSDIDSLVDAGAPRPAASILAARGMAPDAIDAYLAPTLKNDLPNPSFFKDMDKAADRLAAAITAGEQIAIWSDYDVDGATSAATLGRFLRDCGVPASAIYIPDRISEGYGPNADGLLSLQSQGADLVCILDSGTVAFEPLQAAHDANLDVVVVDHHAAEPELPPAVAIVNPNRLDQEEGFGHVCAAGMTFILTIATNLRLRRDGYFDGQDGRPAEGPNLMTYLDLVALGTICDVVPLTTLNRTFVARGLPILSERRLPGIAALAEVAAANDDITVADCGFGLGPRINAGGRIGDSDAGARLLLETDPQAARLRAEALGELNTERQTMEKACTADALEQVSPFFTPGETRALAVAVVDAHEGIVGISAARLKEALDVPSFVLAPTPEGTLKGSGRSVSGFDLGAAIIKARKAGILIKGGGHAMAGGITIERENVDSFIDFVNGEIAKSDYASTGVVAKVDAELPVTEATVGLVESLAGLAPFGMGNPTPRIMLSNALVSGVRTMKDKHVKLTLEGQTPDRGTRKVDALIWNAIGTPFGDALLNTQGMRIDALGALEINEWNDRKRVQMKLDDVRLAASETGSNQDAVDAGMALEAF